MLWIEIILDPRPEICPSLDPSLCFLFLTMWGPGSKFKIHKVDADPQQLITLLTWTYRHTSDIYCESLMESVWTCWILDITLWKIPIKATSICRRCCLRGNMFNFFLSLFLLLLALDVTPRMRSYFNPPTPMTFLSEFSQKIWIFYLHKTLHKFRKWHQNIFVRCVEYLYYTSLWAPQRTGVRSRRILSI